MEIIERPPIVGVFSNDFELRSGNKVLKLRINKKRGSASTKLESIEAERKAGSTTRLYLRAFEIIQAEVERLGKPITYELSTENEKMKKWILDPEKGGSFNWDEMKTKGEELIAKKVIYPIKELQLAA